MGQYWIPVNLDKHEFISPHGLGSGLKLWEQMANHPGTCGALIALLGAEPEARGGGDLDLEENWHGPERTFPEHSGCPGPMLEDYSAIAKQVIGRWAGDRIAIVGDYAEDSDLAPEHKAGSIYSRCQSEEDFADLDPETREKILAYGPLFKDITPLVRRVLEHELGGKFDDKAGYWQWKEGAK